MLASGELNANIYCLFESFESTAWNFMATVVLRAVLNIAGVATIAKIPDCRRGGGWEAMDLRYSCR